MQPRDMPTLVARHYRSGAPLQVRWAQGRISAVEPDPAAAPDLWVAPALLDIQVNGYGGLDFSVPANLGRIAAQLAAFGVARFCPTVITAGTAEMTTALAAIAEGLAADPSLRGAICGVHIEGPYISPADGPRGAHPAGAVRDPDWDHFQTLCRAAAGHVRLVTLAPERPGAAAFIARATAAGLVVAIGHTAAGAAAIAEAAAAGARLCTHLGNGLAETIDRHANPLWPQLAEPRLMASFIADGEHLPREALVAMVAAKGPARSILISDAVRHAGLPPGAYPGIGGGTVLVRPGGRIELAGTPYLAGSGANLAQCVAWAVASGAASAADALDMAAANPARLLGLPPAEIAPGAPADLLLFRWGPGHTLEVLTTIRAGEVVHGTLPAA